MRLEYTEEEERELRLTEIQAILENNLYENETKETELIAEMEELKSQTKLSEEI